MRLPMFPLGTVLLPQQPLPLHVFEPRYRALVNDVLARDQTFGVVLIERGHEVGGGDARFDVGCTAEVLEAQRAPDGRWALSTIGRRPLRVVEWLPDDPYPLAEVEVLDDPAWTDADEAAFDRALAAFRRMVDLAARAGADVHADILQLPGEPVWDHWLLVARAPFGELDRLGMLGAPNPTERLDLLTRHLEELCTVLASKLDGG